MIFDFIAIKGGRKFEFTCTLILHRNYQTMLEDHPRLAKIFPKPPIVSYCRNPNLRSIIISCQPRIRRPSGPSIRCIEKNTKKRGRPCKLCDHIGQIDQLVNFKSKRKCQISGGSCQSKNIIYAAECAKHNLLYVGFTSTTLSQRFNKHRSDSKHDPTATELSKHFHDSNSCSFDRGLRVHVLENVEGGINALLHRESQWMSKLGTFHFFSFSF